MKKIKKKALDLMPEQDFDCLAVGVVDFKNQNYDFFELGDFNFYDLASVTKPLTLASSYFKDPKIFDESMELLLEHRGGLKAWGRLSHKGWREQLLSYDIQSSDTLYSDFSALRLQLEIEKKVGPLKEYCGYFWKGNLCNWKDVENWQDCPITGYRNGALIQGEVHDDNAFVINEFVSHAGCFSNISSLAESLISLDQQTRFVSEMKELPRSQRYVKGWDTVENPSDTLAGNGCSPLTFGHLGFTGTSVWIDPEQMKGSIILTNGTRKYWYSRAGLTTLRKELGQMIWVL